MTSTHTRKQAPKKRRTTKKKKSTGRFPSPAGISRIIIFRVLIIFLCISIGAAGYVIFFRVVVAADPDNRCPAPIAAVVFDRAISMNKQSGAEYPMITDGESR